MKKYVYPIVLFADSEQNGYTVLFPDLDIVASGDTVEEAYVNAGQYLKTYLEFASKMESNISSPSKYDEASKMNPKRVVLLQDADIASEFQLTEEEKEYKNFVQQFVVTVEE